MILSIHQPNYWPYPGLIGKIMRSDKFIYLTKVQFEKRSWQNRNRIKSNNDWVYITIPTYTKENFNQLLCDVKINNEEPWKRKHLKAIKLYYNKTPYYKEYKDFLDDLYNQEWELLIDIDIYIMNFILKELEINTEILYDKNLEFTTNKTQLLIDICRQVGADTYMSNKGSQSYVSIEDFNANNINHIYIDYIGEEYSQIFPGFQPNLSILDMLMNCGKKQTKEILCNNNNYNFSEINKPL